MIDIYNIFAGWLVLKINENSFVASYLTNVVADIDDVLEILNNDVLEAYENPKMIHLDGEGLDLYLTLWKNYNDQLIIVWEEYSDKGKPFINHMIFEFNGFINEWLKLRTRIKDEYNKNFIGRLYEELQ